MRRSFKDGSFLGYDVNKNMVYVTSGGLFNYGAAPLMAEMIERGYRFTSYEQFVATCQRNNLISALWQQISYLQHEMSQLKEEQWTRRLQQNEEEVARVFRKCDKKASLEIANPVNQQEIQQVANQTLQPKAVKKKKEKKVKEVVLPVIEEITVLPRGVKLEDLVVEKKNAKRPLPGKNPQRKVVEEKTESAKASVKLAKQAVVQKKEPEFSKDLLITSIKSFSAKFEVSYCQFKDQVELLLKNRSLLDDDAIFSATLPKNEQELLACARSALKEMGEHDSFENFLWSFYEKMPANLKKLRQHLCNKLLKLFPDVSQCIQQGMVELAKGHLEAKQKATGRSKELVEDFLQIEEVVDDAEWTKRTLLELLKKGLSDATELASFVEQFLAQDTNESAKNLFFLVSGLKDNKNAYEKSLSLLGLPLAKECLKGKLQAPLIRAELIEFWKEKSAENSEYKEAFFYSLEKSDKWQLPTLESACRTLQFFCQEEDAALDFDNVNRLKNGLLVFSSAWSLSSSKGSFPSAVESFASFYRKVGLHLKGKEKAKFFKDLQSGALLEKNTLEPIQQYVQFLNEELKKDGAFLQEGSLPYLTAFFQDVLKFKTGGWKVPSFQKAFESIAASLMELFDTAFVKSISLYTLDLFKEENKKLIANCKLTFDHTSCQAGFKRHANNFYRALTEQMANSLLRANQEKVRAIQRQYRLDRDFIRQTLTAFIASDFFQEGKHLLQPVNEVLKLASQEFRCYLVEAIVANNKASPMDAPRLFALADKADFLFVDCGEKKSVYDLKMMRLIATRTLKQGKEAWSDFLQYAPCALLCNSQFYFELDEKSLINLFKNCILLKEPEIDVIFFTLLGAVHSKGFTFDFQEAWNEIRTFDKEVFQDAINKLKNHLKRNSVAYQATGLKDIAEKVLINCGPLRLIRDTEDRKLIRDTDDRKSNRFLEF